MDDPLVPAPGVPVWYRGTPYCLIERIIGVLWRARELFGNREVSIMVSEARRCKLHGIVEVTVDRWNKGVLRVNLLDLKNSLFL